MNESETMMNDSPLPIPAGLRLHLIVAMTNNGVIGRDGGMPWHLPADLQHFKRTTMGHCIIMGRKTHEAIGRALPGRLNIVITRDWGYRAVECTVVHSVADALKQASLSGDGDAYVIGGAEIYRAMLPHADELHLTRIDVTLFGDAHFSFDDTDWETLSKKNRPADEHNKQRLVFEHLVRRRA